MAAIRLAATIALVAALAVAAGCGDDEETTATETTTESAATGATGPELEQVDPPLEKQDGAGGSSAGGSGPVGASPEQTLNSFFTSGDPDLVCGELATEKALSSAYGDEEGCRQALVPAAVPVAIEVRDLEESGGEATATVVPTGGPNDGIETEVVLVKEGPVWLVDSLEADVPAGP